MSNEEKRTPFVNVGIQTRITSQMVADWVTTAYEGGITYWCRDQEYLSKKLCHEIGNRWFDQVYSNSDYWERGGTCKLWDAESNEMFPELLSMDVVVRGLVKMNKLSHFIPATSRLISGEFDADDCDHLIQIALFGEVVFG